MYGDDLEGAVERWRTSESNHRENQEDLVYLLKENLRINNMTELSMRTGIKRTTLYYLIWGKAGKGKGDLDEQAS